MEKQAKVCIVCGVVVKGRKRADKKHYCAAHKEEATVVASTVVEERVVEASVKETPKTIKGDGWMMTNKKMKEVFTQVKETVFGRKGKVAVAPSIIEASMKDFVTTNVAGAPVENKQEQAQATPEETQAISKAKAKAAQVKECLASHAAAGKEKAKAAYTAVKEGIQASIAFVKENGLWAGIKEGVRRMGQGIKKAATRVAAVVTSKKNELFMETFAMAVVFAAGYTGGVAFGVGVGFLMASAYCILSLLSPRDVLFSLDLSDVNHMKVIRAVR